MSRPNSYVTYVTKLSTGLSVAEGFPIFREAIPDLREAIRESPDTHKGDPVGLHMSLACG
jgi:hypothetical protein